LAGSFRSGKLARVDCSVLRPEEKQLLAFNMIDLGPIHRKRAEDVIDTDIERVGTKPFNLAGDAVAVLHDDDVGFLSP